MLHPSTLKAIRKVPAKYAQHFIKNQAPSKVLTDFNRGEYRVWDVDDLWRFEYWVAEDQWDQSDFVEVGKKLAQGTTTKLDEEEILRVEEEATTKLDKDSKQVEASSNGQTSNGASCAVILLAIGVFAHLLFWIF